MSKRINSPDTEADRELRAYLDITPRVSFNMIAGAGSGKTTSLVKALSHIVKTNGSQLKLRGQQVACITYTEIAAEEIWDDVGNTPLIHVSTIHSYLWEIIRPFQKDIKKWVVGRIAEKQQERQEKIDNPRTRIQTCTKLEKEVAKLNLQAGSVSKVPNFNYGTGSNYSKGILGHDDIIKLVVSCLMESDVLRKIVGQKYPYIFVDESQDTFPEIVEALRRVYKTNGDRFCIGFFGDPMQKIYATGVGQLPEEAEWKIIKKSENFRCSQEVLEVINKIRKSGDGLEQKGGSGIQGSAQLFVLPLVEEQLRTQYLTRVQEKCAALLEDQLWLEDDKIKIFVIVHRMAAKRLKFSNLYAAMNDSAPSVFKDGFMDGTAWPLRPFLKFVLPIVTAHTNGHNSTVMSMVRILSPKLNVEKMKGIDVRRALESLKIGLEAIVKMMDTASADSVLDVLKTLTAFEMADIDERILAHMNGTEEAGDEDDEDGAAKEASAMQRFFECPAHELWGYLKYCENQSPFATQQGVKGAEFDRVITILDDDEGNHNQFSYDKYFGLKNLSETDLENIKEGKDYVIPRTQRLFYVSCSRARKDLVAVYYTSDVTKAVERLKSLNIFLETRIFTIDDLQ